MKIVSKPWGFEFEFFDNMSISIWVLVLGIEHKSGYLLERYSTSEHMHVIKDACVIPLHGSLGIHHMGAHYTVNEGQHHRIRAREFHKLENNYLPVVFLELEVPSRRSDIVRRSDRYGRISNSYRWDLIEVEQTYNYQSELKKFIDKPIISIRNTTDGKYMNISDKFSIKPVVIDSLSQNQIDSSDIIIVTAGEIISDSDETVSLVGDIFVGSDFTNFLAAIRSAYSLVPGGLSILQVSRHSIR